MWKKGFLVYFKDGSEVVRFLLLKILFSSIVKDNQLQKGLGDGNLVRNLKCLASQVIIVKYGKRMKKRKHSVEGTFPKWNLRELHLITKFRFPNLAGYTAHVKKR